MPLPETTTAPVLSFFDALKAILDSADVDDRMRLWESFEAADGSEIYDDIDAALTESFEADDRKSAGRVEAVTESEGSQPVDDADDSLPVGFEWCRPPKVEQALRIQVTSALRRQGLSLKQAFGMTARDLRAIEGIGGGSIDWIRQKYRLVEAQEGAS